MGLMLSVLVVCVGVIEALSCFEHFQYGVIHCATNVYESARRRSSVFLKYTSRRLKLLSENSISEYDEQPELFEPIKIGGEERLSEWESGTVRKPKAIRISARPAKKLEKEDKIQIVKTLLERPRRPPTVRSISMPELVHTEEDIELSKIINDLAIEPIEEINIEIEEGNCEVLSRKFDELFNEDGDNKENSLDDLDENVVDDTKFAQLEAITDYVKSTSEEIDEENLNPGELSPAEVENEQQSIISDDKSVKDDDDFLKTVLEKEKPPTGVIRTKISERVSEKGADYFKEALDKFSQKSGNRFARSISVDFNKVPSMRINKPAARFSEMSYDSMKLISEESISHNKLEDIILESDTPPGEVIDKTFEEIYGNICDESLDAENTFEEIEKNIMGDADTVESQGSFSPIPYEAEDRFIFPEDFSQEGETSLSSGKTVPTAVFLKAVEQLAQLLVRDSLNLHQIKNSIFENLNYENEKLQSGDRVDTHSRSQPENKRESHHVECRIPSESVQEMPDVKDLTGAEERNVPNDEVLGEEPTKTNLVKKYDSTDVTAPVTEEFGKVCCSVVEGGTSDLSVTDSVGSDMKLAEVGTEDSTSKDNIGDKICINLPELEGAITDVENRTESSRKCDQRVQDVVEKHDQSNKSVANAEEEIRDKINSGLLQNEDAVEFMEKVEPQMEEHEFGKIIETEPAPSFPTQSDVLRSEMEEKMTTETLTGFPQTGVTVVAEDNQSLLTQDEIKIVNETNKAIDITNTETKVNKFEPPLGVSESNQTVMPIHEPLLAVQFKKEIHSEPKKIETEPKVEQDKNIKVDTLEKVVAVDPNSTVPSKDVLELKQEEKPLSGQTEKPKDSLNKDTTSPGDSNIAVETMKSKLEPLLALEFKTIVQSEENKKPLAEAGTVIKMEGIPLAVDDKNNSFTDKETVIDSVEKREQEKPLLVQIEKPINSADSKIIDATVSSESIQAGQPDYEALELKKESHPEGGAVREEGESTKMDGKLLQESVKPAEIEQPVLEIHDKDGELVQNVEFQQVDSIVGKNADKSRSDSANISESTKTSIESQMESPCQDNQNEVTRKGIEIKDQSSKTVDVISTGVVDEKNTNKEGAIGVVENLEQEKPTEVETLQQTAKPDTSLGYSDTGESTQILKSVEQKEDNKEKNLEENIQMEEVRPGDNMKQSGLKFHDKPRETEDKMEFEQVEGNDFDKLHKNEAEPEGSGSGERKEEHSSDSKNPKAHESSGATSSAPEAFWLKHLPQLEGKPFSPVRKVKRRKDKR